MRRGDLGYLDGLREAAAGADAVVHLAFDHAAMFAGNFAGAAATDLAVVQAFGDALAGTGKTFIGIGLSRTGDPQRDAAINANPRSAVARAIDGLAERGVRTILVAIPPVTHSAHDRHGFIPMLISIARDTGVSGYVGDGANRWPAVPHPRRRPRSTGWRSRRPRPERSCTPRPRRASRSARSPRPSPATSASRPSASRPRRPRTTSRASRSSPWTSRCPTRTPGSCSAGSRAHPGLIADLDDGHYFTVD